MLHGGESCFENCTMAAAELMNLQYFREFIESTRSQQTRTLITAQVDQGQQLHAYFCWIYLGTVAGDDPCLLQSAHPLSGGWSRQSYPSSQLIVGEPCVLLQVA